MEKSEEIIKELSYFFNEQLERMILSNPRTRDGVVKMVIRPVLLKGVLKFQIEEFTQKQAFHKNLEKEEAAACAMEGLDKLYRNAEVISGLGSLHILIGKKDTVTLKVKRRVLAGAENLPPVTLTHNRQKKYVLEEGVCVPFLVELGVMSREGAVIKSKYDKFRQINRFLEFIEDILPLLNKEKENVILDFGCGKSYLTFAMYYYLKELKGYPIRIIGLDLKRDVIELCNRLSRQFGFDSLCFYQGDIAGYEGVEQADMVVTLHACDTATDFALARAVRWGAEVILSVPCCQHELNGQIENELLNPVLKYGLLKERMSALITDGIRGELLEACGYQTQLLEFIDMEHTPKNIMIRAVKRRGAQRRTSPDGSDAEKRDKENHNRECAALKQMMEGLQADPALYRLLKEQGTISW